MKTTKRVLTRTVPSGPMNRNESANKLAKQAKNSKPKHTSK